MIYATALNSSTLIVKTAHSLCPYWFKLSINIPWCYKKCFIDEYETFFLTTLVITLSWKNDSSSSGDSVRKHVCQFIILIMSLYLSINHIYDIFAYNTVRRLDTVVFSFSKVCIRSGKTGLSLKKLSINTTIYFKQ